MLDFAPASPHTLGHETLSKSSPGGRNSRNRSGICVRYRQGRWPDLLPESALPSLGEA